MSRVILLVLLALLYACGEATAPPATAEQEEMDADNVVLNVTHLMTTDGVRRALMYADTAFVYDDSAQMHLRKVRLELYDEAGRKTADLTADRGRLNTVTRAMTAIGNVDLTTLQTSRRIQTEELHFDPQADRIWSDVNTTMREGGTVINGTGFTADSQMRNVQVTGATGRGLRLRI